MPYKLPKKIEKINSKSVKAVKKAEAKAEKKGTAKAKDKAAKVFQKQSKKVNNAASKFADKREKKYKQNTFASKQGLELLGKAVGRARVDIIKSRKQPKLLVEKLPSSRNVKLVYRPDSSWKSRPVGRGGGGGGGGWMDQIR
jgi:type IV secretory pathway VirB4 component